MNTVEAIIPLKGITRSKLNGMGYSCPDLGDMFFGVAIAQPINNPLPLR